VLRTAGERVADVRRLLVAARRVYEGRAALVPAIVVSTGLSPEGVELGFASLERQAADEELHALVQAAGVARHVHVVLSANVFVAALRALALAVAAAPRVTIRPSPRDPVLARALVEALADPAISLREDRDAGTSGADVVHVYGRDATVARVREQLRARSGVRVLGHGAGLGVALVTEGACLDRAAEALALDVAAFDQRGCLSPRVAFVVGDALRARAFAFELDSKLANLDLRIPRGALSSDERAETNRWRDAVVFAGDLRDGPEHAVAFVPGPAALAIPPAGRHVLVVAGADLAGAQRALAPLAPLVVTVGSDDPASAATVAPAHARIAALGQMQRPPLDGPVDRRTAGAVT
jgi:hypothetical protein